MNDSEFEDRHAQPPVEPAPPIVARPAALPTPPHVGGVLGTILLALLTGLVLQMCFGCVAGMVVAIVSGGAQSPAAVSELINSSIGMVVQIVLAQLGMLLVVFGAARRVPLPLREQYGLNKPDLPGWGWPVIVLATVFVGYVGTILALPVSVLFISLLDAHELRAGVSEEMTIPFVATIALLPGFIEELLFRGYAQRRLLRRVSPAPAILMSSIAFAVMHIDPVHIVFAFPVGIYLGIVEWRTGSIWPCILGHVVLNAWWNISGLAIVRSGVSEQTYFLANFFVVGFGFCGAVLSIPLLAQLEAPRPRGPAVWSPAPDTPAAPLRPGGSPTGRVVDPSPAEGYPTRKTENGTETADDG